MRDSDKAVVDRKMSKQWTAGLLWTRCVQRSTFFLKLEHVDSPQAHAYRRRTL